MRHSHRPRRVAAFVAETVNVRQLQTASEALQRHHRRAVLVSDQHALLRGFNGSAEINFAVAETTGDIDPAAHDALVLMDGASRLADSASGLAKRFMEAGKPVVALTGSAGLLSALQGHDVPSGTTASAIVEGQLYEVADSDADWKILDAIAGKLDNEQAARQPAQAGA
ncbi:DJ-1/PfpI family protein [Maricaulis sp.]|uniref:DJ-1/PfpI family protein n=1 Tax=Maricaulis sp. TaxID=1486257 RepID=UPI00260F9308|nr:DJ-1/PfpI family protein [Maricaulis sp.]